MDHTCHDHGETEARWPHANGSGLSHNIIFGEEFKKAVRVVQPHQNQRFSPDSHPFGNNGPFLSPVPASALTHNKERIHFSGFL